MTVSYSDLRESSKKQGIEHLQDIDNLLASIKSTHDQTQTIRKEGRHSTVSDESIQSVRDQYQQSKNLFTAYNKKVYAKLKIPEPTAFNYAKFDNENYAINQNLVDDLVEEYDYKMGLKERDVSDDEFDLQNMINLFAEQGDCSIIKKFLETRMYVVLELDKIDVSIMIWTFELYGIIVELINADFNNLDNKKYIKMFMDLYNQIVLRADKRIGLIKTNIKFFVKALKIDNPEECQNILHKILENDVIANDIQLLIDFIEDFYYTLHPNETKTTSAQTFLEGAMYYINGYGIVTEEPETLIENGGFAKPVPLPSHLTEFHPYLKCSVSKTEINNSANSLRRLNCGHLFGQRAISDWYKTETHVDVPYDYLAPTQMPEITCPYCQKKTLYKDIKPATFVNLNLFVLENLYDYIKE